MAWSNAARALRVRGLCKCGAVILCNGLLHPTWCTANIAYKMNVVCPSEWRWLGSTRRLIAASPTVLPQIWCSFDRRPLRPRCCMAGGDGR
ncbi:hypothetical protein GY45DRAFT_542074 [Cubamyces sp. BRFM 1775]|nr:hypothetical protein GY45DRAFT_542074 [Cubamyces sp. BRFM 1775]